MRDSTIIYRSFFEAIRELPDQNQSECWRAIFEYVFESKTNELTGLSKMVFTLIKPQLDANNNRYEIGKKYGHLGAKHGKKGGRPKKDDKEKTPKGVIEETLKKPANENENENKNVNKNVNANEKEKLKAEITKSLSGNGRTPEQVEQVATEQVAEFEKEFQTLSTWIKTNTPRVAQMKEPFTLMQFVHLKHKIPDKQKIKDLLLSMHNWKDLQTKNVSAYLTILKWSKNDS